MASDEVIAADTEYRDSTVVSVTEYPDKGFSFQDDDGYWLAMLPLAEPPQIGDHVRFYGRGIGYTVRGVAFNGRVVHYRTEEEDRQRWQEEAEARRREKREALDRERAERDGRWAALPDPMKLRVLGFVERGGDTWRAEFEPYELFVCEEAVKFAAVLGAETDWSDRDAIEAKIKAAGVESDQHSGNTYGAALRLAALLTVRPEAVPKEHGALCPLVGCVEQFCFATVAPAEGATRG